MTWIPTAEDLRFREERRAKMARESARILKKINRNNSSVVTRKNPPRNCRKMMQEEELLVNDPAYKAYLEKEIEREKREVVVCQKKKHIKMKGHIEHLSQHGYVFMPTEDQLFDDFLLSKNLGNPMDYSLIEEKAHHYTKHPQQLLIGEANFCYFFTQSLPPEEGHQLTGQEYKGFWIPEEEEIVNTQGNQIGYKKLLQYYQGGQPTSFKIIKYKIDLDPTKLKTGLWYLCKLYKDGVA